MKEKLKRCLIPLILIMVMLPMALVTLVQTTPASEPVPALSSAELVGSLSVAPQPEILDGLPPQITPMTWWEAFLRGVKRDYFIGYTVAMILAIVALFLKTRRVRYAILLGAVIFLGFYVNLRLSGLGGPSTLILALNNVKVNFPFYMIWIVIVLLGLVAGRTFCGWVCPMGAWQQLQFLVLNFLSRRLFHRELKLKTSPRVHRVLRYLRYVVLVVLLATVWFMGAGYWGPSDPFRALFRLDFDLTPTIILGFVLLGSVFFFAPWCKYVCPLGALLSVFSKVSLFKVRIDEGLCTDCKRCARLDCDFLAITTGDKGVIPKINQLECTSCGECILKCPDAAISMGLFAFGRKK